MATNLIQCGAQGGTVSNIESTLSVSSGAPNFPTTVATPPYLNAQGQVMPYMRFIPATNPLTNTTSVVDLVMPAGPGNPGSFYCVLYVCNATPALT